VTVVVETWKIAHHTEAMPPHCPTTDASKCHNYVQKSILWKTSVTFFDS